MKFIAPKFERKSNPAGVYKLTFDDKWFYIGSSKILRKRMRSWRTRILTGNHLTHINIKNLLPEISVVIFEVVKIYANSNLISKAETKLINKNWDNPFLLNRCPVSGTLKSMRPYIGYVKPTPTPKPKKATVATFTHDDVLIKIYKNKNQACIDLKIRNNDMNGILLSKRGQPKRLKIKLVTPDGVFIEPEKFIPKKNKLSKRIIQMDKDGNFISEYESVSEAVRKLNWPPYRSRNLSNVLKGVKWFKTIQGYKFKYA